MGENVTQFVNITVNEFSNRLLVSAWYGILSSVGFVLTLSVLFITVVQRHANMLPFFIFLINMLVANLASFLTYLTYAVPCMATGVQVYGTDVGAVYSCFSSIIFLTFQQNSFLISVNRSLTICKRSLHDKFFTLKFSKILAVSTWVFSGLITVINQLIGCSSMFMEKKFFYSRSCATMSSHLSVFSLISYGCVYGVAIFYLIAVWHIWKSKKEQGTISQQAADNMSKYQMNLFYQAIFIWLTLLGHSIGFNLLSLTLQGVPATIVSAVLVMMNNYSTPICMLVFSKETKLGVKKLFTKNQSSLSQTRKMVFGSQPPQRSKQRGSTAGKWATVL